MYFLGIFPISHALFILAVSFFVLLGATKAESRVLKEFGRLIAIALWIVAIYLIAITIYLGFTYGSGVDRYMPYAKMHKFMMPK